MTHPTFEELSELAGDAQARTENRHLAECERCRETVRRIEQLVGSARALPREIEPPPEVWAGLRDRMAERSVARARWRASGWIAVAATIVIAVGLTVLLPGPGRVKGRVPTPEPSSSAATSAAPIALISVERNYVATVDELRRTLDAQRSALAPTTVRIVERSLATIDTAIAEARAALESDPANQALLEVLAASYERKVELLQRATKLSSSL